MCKDTAINIDLSAWYLEVSTDHIKQLIEDGTIQADEKGIAWATINEYRRKRKEAQRKALDELTEQAQKLGLYDNPAK